MKQKILTTLILLLAIKSFSQNSRISLEANFPIPIGDNNLGHSYGGIVDIGVKYIFSELEKIKIGASINGSLLRNYKDDYNLWDSNIYAIQPKIFTEFNIKNIEKLHPHISLGYSFLVYKTFENGVNTDFLRQNIDGTDKGINLNLGVSYNITDRLFLQSQYDFIYITASNYTKENFSILKFGIGIRI